MVEKQFPAPAREKSVKKVVQRKAKSRSPSPVQVRKRKALGRLSPRSSAKKRRIIYSDDSDEDVKAQTEEVFDLTRSDTENDDSDATVHYSIGKNL